MVRVLLLEDYADLQKVAKRIAQIVSPRIEIVVVDCIEDFETAMEISCSGGRPFNAVILDNSVKGGRKALEEGLHLKIQSKFPKIKIALNSSNHSYDEVPGMENLQKNFEDMEKFLKSLLK